MLHWHSPCGRSGSAPRHFAYRPRLEVLEGRCLPSTVTNLNDAGPGSLRQAILDAPPGGTVDFQPGLSGTITLTSGELLLNKDLTIAGPGVAVMTVSGNHASRVFEVAATFTVNISGLTIANGSVANANGGGIYNAGTLTLTSSTLSGSSANGGSSFTVDGGGIYNAGTLSIASSTLSGNTAIGRGNLANACGGGIYNTGTLTLTSSTLSGSSATASDNYPDMAQGGGIYNAGALTITGSTLNNNSANGFTASQGGGIFNSDTLTLTDSTLSGSSAGMGGGIENSDGTVALTSSTLSHNVAFEWGGGIQSAGTLTITSCTFSFNSVLVASGYGGGIEIASGTATITSSTLNGNSSALAGGGIDNNGTLTITSSTLNGNSAVSGGGGINSGGINSGSMLTITSSTLSGNSALGGGGLNHGGTATITSSTLSDNFASGRFPFGGGIASGGYSTAATLSLTNCILSGNSAATGGGIHSYTYYADSTVSLTNCTLSGNSAATGGGIYNTGYSATATLSLTSSTLSGNLASGGPGGGIVNIVNTGYAIAQARNTIIAGNTAASLPDVSGPLASQGHNLIGDGTGGSGYDPTDLVGTASNPIDPKLGPLADNGGPTLTMALLPGSPAIDAGDNTDAPMWDQRGAPFRRIVNGTIDIGAFEVQARGHGGPTGQPLPDPVPIQILGAPAGPLLGQPPDLPADSSPLPGMATPDGQAGQPQTEPAPVRTTGGQQAAETFTVDGRNGQPVDTVGPLDCIPVELPALGLPG
jgi:hypothetical protein